LAPLFAYCDSKCLLGPAWKVVTWAPVLTKDYLAEESISTQSILYPVYLLPEVQPNTCYGMRNGPNERQGEVVGCDPVQGVSADVKGNGGVLGAVLGKVGLGAVQDDQAVLGEDVG